MAETHKRRKLQPKVNNSSENSNINGEDARLSSLPDALVLEILSLLPLKYAAATSVLSHRWHHLWTQLPHLSFDSDNPPWNHSRLPSNGYPPNRKQIFIDTVDHILRRITSPHIQTFTIRIPNYNSKISQAKFKSWVRLISKRNVAAIKVIRKPPSRTPLPTLPNTIFEIRSLVHLQLVGFLQCKLPSVVKGIVNLPNLKKLQLDNIIWDDLQKLWALISSCPLLEVLSLGLKFYNDGVVNVNISSPMLKSLIIDYSNNEVKFSIDTPMLEHLALTGCVGCYSFVQYPTKLMKAELNVHVNGPFTNNEFSKVLPLIQRISGVKSLSLSFMNFFKAVNYLKVDVGSIFYDLTHLKWTWPSVDSNLDVQNILPVCLFSKLKRLELLKMKANANNIKMLEYILSKANVLERLHVSSGDYAFAIGRRSSNLSYFVGQNKDILWWEYQIYNTLLAAPKSSLLSDIEFVGTYIHALRDRSQNGFIVTINSQTKSPTSTVPFNE